MQGLRRPEPHAGDGSGDGGEDREVHDGVIGGGADEVERVDHPKRTEQGGEEQEQAGAERADEVGGRQAGGHPTLEQGGRVATERRQNRNDGEEPKAMKNKSSR